MKFIFSDIMGRLRVRLHVGVDNARCLCQSCLRVHWIERTYSFFGPSPRGLLHCLLQGQRCSDPLAWWRRLLFWVNELVGTDHSLYMLQMNPCEWRAFLRTVRRFSHVESTRRPASIKTKARCDAEMVYKLECKQKALFFHLLKSSPQIGGFQRLSVERRVKIVGGMDIGELSAGGDIVTWFNNWLSRELKRNIC